MHGMKDCRKQKLRWLDSETCVGWYYILRRTDVFAQVMRGGQANTKFLSAYDITTRGEEMLRL
jgi:hypothetical protein